MFAIGMGKLLVGRSQHCDHPDAASKLPSVGGFADPNLESIIALRPTIVIGSQGPAGPALEAKQHRFSEEYSAHVYDITHFSRWRDTNRKSK